MEGALVSAATGALKPVLGKLATLLGDEYKRFKRVRSEVGFLTRELAAMEAFLFEKSKQEDPDEQTKLWMKEVRELSYDIEDKLDDFMVHVGDGSAKPNGFMGKIKNLFDKTKARRQIAKAIEDSKKQVNEASERHARYKADEAISNANNATVDPRALAIFEDASEFIGIDGPKGELIQLFTEDTRCEQPKVISVVGIGGLGKTTLAYQVYQELKGQFDCHAFFSVSRNPDAKTVLKIILSKLKGYSSSMDDVPQLITEILDFLANKRYFIVIDDIWDVKIWDVIKLAFPRSGCDGRIITTTRMNVVAQSCCSSFNGHIYNMEPLSMVHSRLLFHRRLFNSEECPSHLEKVSGQILKKCAGLPLAIIAISGLLANKAKTKDQWCQVENSIGRGLERNSSIEAMIEIISLSYFDLPHHLKTCLLYLSIFPEDHVIGKELLIRRWIAEGFIHNKDRYTLYEVGEMCFNELLNRSLIQPDLSNRIFDEVSGCRVHDIILDFIVSKSTGENFVTILGVPGINPDRENKVRRLSLQNGSEIPAGVVLSDVRSLSIFGDRVKIPSLLELKHLRVLCFEGCWQLEDHHLAHIGNCLHLKCLILRGISITKVPEEIGKLQNLETLEVDKEVLMPSTFSLHGRLVHLSSNYSVIILPNEIEGMDALEFLGFIVIGEDQSTNFIRRLGDLKNLRKLLLHVSSCADQRELVCSIRKLVNANLCCLVILLSSMDFEADNFLEELNLPAECSLQEFFLMGLRMSKVPRWMGSLVNLQKLATPVSSPEDAEILGGLPSLRYLGVVASFHGLADSTKAAVERVIAAHSKSWKLFEVTNQVAARAYGTLQYFVVFQYSARGEIFRLTPA